MIVMNLKPTVMEIFYKLAAKNFLADATSVNLMPHL